MCPLPRRQETKVRKATKSCTGHGWKTCPPCVAAAALTTSNTHQRRSCPRIAKQLPSNCSTNEVRAKAGRKTPESFSRAAAQVPSRFVFGFCVESALGKKAERRSTPWMWPVGRRRQRASGVRPRTSWRRDGHHGPWPLPPGHLAHGPSQSASSPTSRPDARMMLERMGEASRPLEVADPIQEPLAPNILGGCRACPSP